MCIIDRGTVLVALHADLVIAFALALVAMVRRTSNTCTSAAVESAVADTLRLSKSSPLLVQLKDRPWGASASLPLSILPGIVCYGVTTT